MSRRPVRTDEHTDQILALVRTASDDYRRSLDDPDAVLVLPPTGEQLLQASGLRAGIVWGALHSLVDQCLVYRSVIRNGNHAGAIYLTTPQGTRNDH